jgi:hypothetical protein
VKRRVRASEKTRKALEEIFSGRADGDRTKGKGLIGGEIVGCCELASGWITMVSRLNRVAESS